MYLMHGKKILDTGFVSGDVSYPAGWIALATPAERDALGIIQVADPVRPDSRMGEVIENIDGSFTLIPHDLETVIGGQIKRIDDAVAAVYTKWTRFEIEYRARENEARAYKAANYTGTPGDYLTSYAQYANIDLRTACDNVLTQADMFALALKFLGDARMRKYEVRRATTPSAAVAAGDQVVAAISDIAAQIV